jgi:phospholipase C
MGKISRREFLGLSAAAAGAAASTKLPLLVRSAMAMQPLQRSASAIRHVVVLMQENRSFDHYFGTLRGVRGFDDHAVLRRFDGTTAFDQTDAQSTIVRPFLHGAPSAITDLDHSWDGTHDAWNEGNYDAWVRAKGAASMEHLDRTAIPYHFELADSFTICDNYFCSVMGATNPNRLYLWSGTCDPDGVAGGPAIDNTTRDFRWTTYPERLQGAGVDWKIYQNADDNFDDNALAWFRNFKNAQPGTPLYERGMASTAATSGDTCSDIVAAIENDVRSGTLPFASWIVPPEECSEHPSHGPDKGAAFIARVLAALMSNPDVWSSTVLLINYDENDGFFDHVPPPVAPSGTPNEFIAGMPIGLGPRVPMLVVSPWSAGGHVCSQVFDHTSVIRFMENLTGVAEPNISQWRRRVCGDLMSAFDFSTSISMIDERQISDARPASALPYQPNANAIFDIVSRKMIVDLSNDGSESVHFAVHSSSEINPRRYDVSAKDGHVADAFSFGSHDRYDVAIHGPNGFLRQFTGNASSADVVISCDYDFDNPTGARVRMTTTNVGSERVTLRIAANCGADSKKVIVDAAESVTLDWDVELYTNGWYDLTVSYEDASDFRWRFAGHVETGNASVSG